MDSGETGPLFKRTGANPAPVLPAIDGWHTVGRGGFGSCPPRFLLLIDRGPGPAAVGFSDPMGMVGCVLLSSKGTGGNRGLGRASTL